MEGPLIDAGWPGLSIGPSLMSASSAASLYVSSAAAPVVPVSSTAKKADAAALPEPCAWPAAQKKATRLKKVKRQ